MISGVEIFAQLETWDSATPATTSGCVMSNLGLPHNGWTADPGDVNTNFRVWSGPTTSAATGPALDLCGGGNYIYMEASCGATTTCTLNSPVFDATGLANPAITFYYHMFGNGMGTLECEASDGVGGWSPVITPITGNQGDIWIRRDTLVPTFDIGNGPQAQIRFRATRGSSLRSDIALDNISFAEFTPPTGPIHQENFDTASLSVDGLQCQDLSMGMCPLVAPGQRSFVNGEVMTWTVSTIPNASQAFSLFLTPGFGVNAGSPGIPVFAGIVDFLPAAIPSLQVAVDGIAGSDLFDLLLGQTDSMGTRSFQFPMPAGPSGSTLTSAQALATDPTSANGLQLTRAWQIDRTIIPSTLPALPSAFQGTNPVTGLLDDNFVSYIFQNGFVFPFYGASYTSCWINSNGSISFGTTGSSANFNSSFNLHGQQARIAAWWTNLNPSAGGAVSLSETQNDLVISFDVPTDGSGLLVRTGIRLDDQGLVEIEYAGMEARDALIGISPGINSPQGSAIVTQPIDLATPPPGSINGGTLESIFDLFTNSGLYGIRNDPCLGVVTGRTRVTFTPNAGGLVVGDMGYSAP